jgi:hypothetical protein
VVAQHRYLAKLLRVLAVKRVLVHGAGSASSVHRSCRPASAEPSSKIGWRRRRLHWHAVMGFTMPLLSRRQSRSALRQLQAVQLSRHRHRLCLSSHHRRSDTKPLVIMRLPMVGAVHVLPTGLLRPSRFPGVCSLRLAGHRHHCSRPQLPTMVPGQKLSGAAVHLPRRLLRPSRRPATRGLCRELWHPPGRTTFRPTSGSVNCLPATCCTHC